MSQRLRRRDIRSLGDKDLERQWNANRHIYFAAEDALDAPDSRVVTATEHLLLTSRRELPYIASLYLTKRSASVIATQTLRVASENTTKVLGLGDAVDPEDMFEQMASHRQSRLPRVLEVVHHVTKMYPLFTVYYPDVLEYEELLSEIDVAVQAYPPENPAKLAI